MGAGPKAPARPSTSTLETPYLDMHPGPAQQAQCGISGTVNPQGHLLPQLLQAPLQLGSPAGKEFWRALPAPPHRPEGWQGGEDLRETVLGIWFSGPGWNSPAFLQLIVHRPANAKRRGSEGQWVLFKSSTPGYWAAQNSLQISVPSEPFCDDPGSSRAQKSQAVTEESEAHTPEDTGHLPGVVVGSPLKAR